MQRLYVGFSFSEGKVLPPLQDDRLAVAKAGSFLS